MKNWFYCLLGCILLLVSCAKQGFPNGGPRDATPPQVLGVAPQQGTLQFEQQSFVINFDEYVVLKDADNNVLVSPPMSKKPQYATKGRSVVVSFKDTLSPNATYLFQFKNAIADFTEGNLLENFEYVFSTGSSLDSMTLRGCVVDALTLKPREETITVVLYEEDSVWTDSVVMKQSPDYVTRCDKEGNFAFNYIRPAHYRLFAYEDLDKNLRYDKGEMLAFATAAVEPLCIKDSVAMNDSTKVSAADRQRCEMRIAATAVEMQRIDKSNFLRKGYIEIVAKQPLSQHCEVRAMGGQSLYVKHNRKGDSLAVWTAKAECDSIVLIVSDTNLIDTLSLTYRPKKGAAAAKQVLPLQSKVSTTHPYYDTLWLHCGNPIVQIEGRDSVVRVLRLQDSSVNYCGVTLHHEGFSSSAVLGNRVSLNFEGKPGEKYQFTLLPQHFYDLYGYTSDTLTFTTQYTKSEEYGNIHIDIQGAAGDEHLVVQLLNEKDEIQQQQPYLGSALLFLHLKPAKYRLRLLYDTDGNNHWTNGDYWQGRQPERVQYFDKTLEVRANWDVEEKWLLH